MVSAEIREKVFGMLSEAFNEYVNTVSEEKLRIVESYFHIFTIELATKLWNANIPEFRSAFTFEELLEHQGEYIFISFMGMPVTDIHIQMQDHFKEEEWDFMILDEATYSIVSPADLLLSSGRYEIYSYDLERMAIGLKLLVMNGVDLNDVSSITQIMADNKGATLWQNWELAVQSQLKFSDTTDFKQLLNEVFMFNINLFFDFADQDNFDQDDRCYPILDERLANHLIACDAITDPDEWKANIGKHVYIWQYDMDNYLGPDEILQIDTFEEGQWYFMTHHDAQQFLDDTYQGIAHEGYFTVVSLWWSGSMTYFLEKK